MAVFVENRKVLFVDDEPEILNAFSALMRKENLRITTLQDSKQINYVLEKEGPFAVILSDQRMPDYDGVYVLETAKNKLPDAIRVLVTGYSDHTDTIRAINAGEISAYISKPWDDNDLKIKINDWLLQFNLKKHNKFLLKQLDDENKKLCELLDGTVAQTVRILGDIANHISPQVANLNERVKVVGNAFLKSFPNLSPDERWDIMRALDLFNIGIALLPPSIQNLIEKHGLSVLERSSIAHNHHLLAAGLLKEIPRFQNAARIVELQARNYNGSGIPLDDYTKEEEIPFGARLLHILIDLIKTHSRSLTATEILMQMETQPKKYDVAIISQILRNNIFPKYDVNEKLVPLSELEPGMVLIDDVRSINDQLLMKSGITLTNTFINILILWHKGNPIVEPIKVKLMV